VSWARFAPVVRVVSPSWKLSLRWWLAWQLAKLAARGLRWLARRPLVALGLAAGLAAWWAVQAVGLSAPAPLVMAAGGIGGWGATTGWRPPQVSARSSWRRLTLYRQRWSAAMTSARLADGDALPTLGGVRSTPGVDVVRARMLPGQVLEDWTKVAPRLAQTFGVREVRPRAVRGDVHAVDLHCATVDTLAAVVQPATPGAVDLQAVPVGRTDSGAPLTLPLLYAHVLVGGETGSGKGSVLWSLLVGVGPAIRERRVVVWAVDPKGGMELGPGAALFDRFAYDGPEAAARLLEDAVARMRKRAEILRAAGCRKFVPTPGDPLVVVVIDELAALLSYVTDPKLRKRLTDAVSLLLSQGRAVGVCVVGASQDVRKETLTLRDLFPVRVALRASEDEQADQLLGRGARARGALTDRIDPRTPGVGYVARDGVPEPVRVRFSHVTDAHISAAVERYGRQLVAA